MSDYVIAHWATLAGGVLLGAGTGMLTGLFGAGGGFIVTPMLNILLGVEMNFAVGTSACQVLGASTFTLAHRLDRRLLGARVALCVGLGIPLGSFPGAWLVQRLKTLPLREIGGKAVSTVDVVLLSVFAVFLLAVAALMVWDNRRETQSAHAHKGLLAHVMIPPIGRFRTIPSGRFSIPLLMLLGVAVGFLSGLLGIGGGVIMMPALCCLVGQDIKAAALSSTMIVCVSGIFGTLFHAVDGNIDYLLAAALIVGAFGGTKAGCRLQSKLHARSLRKHFILVVLAAWCMVVWKLIRLT